MTHFIEDNKNYGDFVKSSKNSKVYASWVKGYMFIDGELSELASNTTSMPKISGYIREDIINHYANNGVELSPELAEKELFAKFCGETFFTDAENQQEALKSLLEAAQTQEQRNSITQFFKDLIEWFKAKLGGNHNITLELVKLQNGWARMIKESGELTTESSVKSEGARYSTSQNVSSETDSEGNKLTKEQQEYFKDSKVRDEDGNLQKVYHGTYEDFTVFNIDKTASENAFGKGHYFTSSKADAEYNYASSNGGDVKTKIEGLAILYFEEMGHDDNDQYDNEYVDDYNDAYDRAEDFYKSGKVIETYLNIINPLYADEYGNLKDINGNKVSFNSSELAIKKGYDGIIDRYVSQRYKNVESGTVHYIILDSNQAKLTANLNPTSNPDIRYSIPAETDKEYLELAKDPEKNKARLQEMVDEAAKIAMPDTKALDKYGKLLKVYHGTADKFNVFDKKTRGKKHRSSQCKIGVLFYR